MTPVSPKHSCLQEQLVVGSSVTNSDYDSNTYKAFMKESGRLGRGRDLLVDFLLKKGMRKRIFLVF